eukprot:TRINITY_DN6046_c0_g1_i2.p1 TRINITY_DN6046_c0_g1~~TRINITY_DN6046_c0_g1_i2.p1  ORF type:complete len:190 (-),score=21.96 TRINITY_DN6046_c0_g1_i2:70-576(-)
MGGIVAFGAEKAGLEQRLAPHFADEKLWLGVLAIGVMFVNQLMTGLVIGARAKYGVGHPIAYPTERDVKSPEDRVMFICAQRSHGNYLEWLLPNLITAIAAWFLTDAHATTIAASLVWLAARAAYGVAYSSGDAAKRTGPFVVSFLAQCLVYGTVVLFVARRALPGFL